MTNERVPVIITIQGNVYTQAQLRELLASRDEDEDNDE